LLIAVIVEKAMMEIAQGNGPFIAYFSAHGSRLSEKDMMGMARGPTTNQATL
jgi:hypothetical protein